MPFKRQVVRDPLHNLIEFRADEFEDAMWRVLQTRPFQRLRRIKQLGFSELVYPGATHSRFAHSVGVFHTARMLVELIRHHLGSSQFQQSKAQVALAAALLHDIGHGPFSHAFEDIGRRHGLRLAKHERLSEAFIRHPEISTVLKSLGSGFDTDVADMIASAGPSNIYGAIVSSQFDSDRLDYMRRDRLMSGTQHGSIDFDWLLSNLEIGEIPYGSDEESVGTLQTFVLGPKATFAAESYILGLFQLYPTVYLHKTTRGAEKLFSEILNRVILLTRDDSISKTGLSASHPLIRFAQAPDKIETIISLDDTAVWGALSMMTEASDETISDFAKRLRDRNLFKCFDLRARLSEELHADSISKSKSAGDGPANKERLDSACIVALARLEQLSGNHHGEKPRLLIDETERVPYRRFQESKGPLNQILIRTGNSAWTDVAKLSPVVNAIDTFKVLRAYVAQEDMQFTRSMKNIIKEVSKLHAN